MTEDAVSHRCKDFSIDALRKRGIRAVNTEGRPMTEPKKVRRVIRRLYRLADGGEPSIPMFGVCANGDDNSWGIVHETTYELYGSHGPISHMIKDGPSHVGMWSGKRGHLRRILAGIIGAELEWRLKHG